MSYQNKQKEIQYCISCRLMMHYISLMVMKRTFTLHSFPLTVSNKSQMFLSLHGLLLI